MHLDVVTAPAAEPVLLATAKAHLRVDGTDENDLITALIVAARQYVENRCDLALINQTLQLTLDSFVNSPRRIPLSLQEQISAPTLLSPDKIRLPRSPVTAITSISYVDGSGNTVTVAANANTLWRLAKSSMQSVITPYFGTCWPVTAVVPGAVQITYTAGYGAAGTAVPGAITQAMLLMIGHWYKNREAVSEEQFSVPMAVDALLAPYVVPVV